MRPPHTTRFKLASVCLGAALCFAGSAAAQTWTIVSQSGQITGKGERAEIALDDGTETVTIQSILLQRDARKSDWMETTHRQKSDAEQILMAETLRTVLRRNSSDLSAEFAPEAITVTRAAAGHTARTKLSLPEDFRNARTPDAAESEALRAGAPLAFSVFDLRTPGFETLAFERVMDGEQTRIVRRTFTRFGLMDETLFDVPEGGDWIARARAGHPMRLTRRVDGTTPDKIDAEPVTVRDALFKSPYRISDAARRGQIRYTFRIDAWSAYVPPQTGEQSAASEAGLIQIDVCETCGQGLPIDQDYLERARQPTFWMQSDHKSFQSLAKRARKGAKTDAEIMRRLEKNVAARVRAIDFAGHVSALEGWKAREWDCTESAVILAASARAAGLPALVASGLVYSRERYHGVSNVFMPHAWAIVYVDGKWTSFDAAVDGFDSTHLAFTVGEGDPAQIAAGHAFAYRLQWQSMAAVE